MDKIGQPYSITRVPWTRAQRDTERGVFDGFFQASRNAQRDAYAVYSEPFVWIKWLYVTRKGSGISPEDTDFNTRIFSANMGSARFRWLQVKQESGEISKLTPVETPYVAIKMMLTDRVDVVLTNDFDLKGVFEEQSLDPDSMEIFTAREVPTGAYFSKDFVANNPGFLDRFNQRIKECGE
jgi:ABC-type amino acid transport substrate-binding protein